jgi:hypothetical protein
MMGLYIIFISWGNSIGPLAGGFIIAGTVSLTKIKVGCADNHSQALDGDGTYGYAVYSPL